MTVGRLAARVVEIVQEREALYQRVRVRRVLTAEDCQRGVAVAGGWREGVTPPDTTVLWRHESSSIGGLLAEFWLPSDNLMGELLLKELGVAGGGEPGTTAAGFTLEREYLRSAGVDPATVSFADASGLSVYDRITPRDLVSILQDDWHSPRRQNVLDALPESGVRGTLKTAFSGTSLEARVFAKTGTARHTRALSGYLQTTGHGPVTFSAESVICTSVRAKSPVLQMPMVGAATAGSWIGG